MWRMRAGITVSSTSVGRFYLTIQVIGPGSLVVSNGLQSIRLLGDELQEDNKSSVHLLRLCLDHSSVFLREPDDLRPGYWVRTISLILQSIVAAGHGGALFILDGDIKPAGLEVKYPLQPQSSLIRDAALQVKAAESAHNEAFARIVLEDSIANVSMEAEAAEEVVRRVQDWEDSIECVGRLALVDGAVVLRRDLRVVGFGAVVRRVGKLQGVQVEIALNIAANRRSPCDLDEKGTRHRSAVAFCWQNPGAVAFVVSHDGGISAMRHIDGAVVVWRLDRLHASVEYPSTRRAAAKRPSRSRRKSKSVS